MYYIIVFIFGSIWGSFSNVCIHRIPENTSVIKGRSYCPSCKKKINWFDNIPLLSFIILKAKCRSCPAKISSKYFLVELISALSFVLIFYLYSFSLTTLLFFILSISFIIIFFYRFKTFYHSKWTDLSIDDNWFYKIFWSQSKFRFISECS